MKVALPHFTNDYDGEKLRQAVLLIQQAFDKILLFTGPAYLGVSASVTPRTSTASAVTVTLNDWLLLVDTSAGAVTVTLPTPSAAIGRCFEIKRTTGGGAALTVETPSGTIDGAPTASIPTQYVALIFYSDGTDYWLI
jgi:hypothetical protein